MTNLPERSETLGVAANTELPGSGRLVFLYGSRFISRSRRDMDKPLFFATVDRTIGPSCLGSPARTTWPLPGVSIPARGMRHSGSTAWPLSSTKMALKWSCGIPADTNLKCAKVTVLTFTDVSLRLISIHGVFSPGLIGLGHPESYTILLITFHKRCGYYDWPFSLGRWTWRHKRET